MKQQEEIKKRVLPLTLKTIIFFWMLIVVFVFLILFGPPEFWSISERLGLGHFFRVGRDWLEPYFIAGYLE
jgi:hypothetical protein